MVDIAKFSKIISLLLLFSFLVINDSFAPPFEALIDAGKDGNTTRNRLRRLPVNLRAHVLDFLPDSVTVLEFCDEDPALRRHISCLDFRDEDPDLLINIFKGRPDQYLNAFISLKIFKMPWIGPRKLNVVTDVTFKDRSHLRVLELRGDQYTDDAVVMMQQLISLSLEGKKFTDKALVRLVNLTSLDLTGDQFTDAAVANKVHLRSLTLAGRQFTDKAFAGLTNLASLALLGHQYTDAAFAGLAALRSLRLTRCRQCTDGAVAKLVNLTDLSLQGGENQYTDAALANKPYLRSLEISLGQFTDSGVSRLESLTSLSLGGHRCTDAAVFKLKNLTSLTLIGEQFTDAAAVGLTKLSSLVLRRGYSLLPQPLQYTHAIFSNKPHLTSVVVIGENQFTNESFSGLVGLEQLSVDRSTCTKAVAVGKPNLKKLELNSRFYSRDQIEIARRCGLPIRGRLIAALMDRLWNRLF